MRIDPPRLQRPGWDGAAERSCDPKTRLLGVRSAVD